MTVRRILNAVLVIVSLSCSFSGLGNSSAPYEPRPYVQITHPDWAKNATIYQINTRQFTPQGTFAAAQEQLPRLKKLGVDILWLMPVHPIGEKNRKGKLGSPYSVKDYYGVNPEFGNLADLKSFVNAAHSQGMYVILDWVANHTAWDNPLAEKHPDWYEKDPAGNFRPTPWWDWSDIIDLDYSQPGLRQYMTEAMKYWVKEADIDGYRADVAGFVPVDFWENVRRELDSIKPVFMLAEWESRDLHARAFDMTYAWSWHEAVMHTVRHEGDLNKLFIYYSWNESAYPKAAYRMTYIDNHDANAWEGTMYERFGEGLEAAMVLSVVGEGMPLIYNGVEAGNDKALAFFDKDPIEWREHHFSQLLTRLNQLLEGNTALWHGEHGATMVRVWNDQPNHVFSFLRENDRDKVLVLINFSSAAHTVTLEGQRAVGEYTEYLQGEKFSLSRAQRIEMSPWSYKVLVR
ncbi:alpha-amlyase [Alteromonas aestuariivivens]|uniref:Alpha-amlyase n=1 Tax=Alteromonas aestuariivivens TaxID=1938339 RepID=A0A3D8M9S0_9ALTE|nr:alpha-amylase family glycosyl hydrolase [Alteromonas aestuariivivens]RDV26060.1 alpha-amlyase [Alteromonas aestuariivivens]